MRVSLIHGEDSASAYNKYRALIDQSRSRGFEIIPISNLKEINSQSLFEDKLVFTLNTPNKIKLDDWKWFSKNADRYDSNFLLYWEGDAPATVVKNFPKNTKFEKFDLPKVLFIFLDSIIPGNVHKATATLHTLISSQAVELVSFMLARHLRDLYWARMSAETMEIPEWRALKLQKQADKFNDGVLEEMIADFAEIDIKTKTGQGELLDLLDILLIKYLE